MSAIIWHRTMRFVLAGLMFAALQGAAGGQDSSQKSTGDPVADAARKARNQKKNEAKPKKVYTNEDMNDLPANAVSTLGSAPAPGETGNAGAENSAAKPKEQADTATANGEDKDPEKMWRRRFREAYGRLAQLEKELEILQREQSKAQLQYYPDPQEAMRQGYTRKEINDKDTKIAAKKQEIDQQKRQISDMEDALRKAGGDPGWASPQ